MTSNTAAGRAIETDLLVLETIAEHHFLNRDDSFQSSTIEIIQYQVIGVATAKYFDDAENSMYIVSAVGILHTGCSSSLTQTQYSPTGNGLGIS